MKLVENMKTYNHGVDILSEEIQAVREHQAKILNPIIFALTGNPFISDQAPVQVDIDDDGGITVAYESEFSVVFFNIPWEVAAAVDPIEAGHEYRRQLEILEMIKTRDMFHEILVEIRDEVNRDA
jgi:hypothetical protein